MPAQERFERGQDGQGWQVDSKYEAELPNTDELPCPGRGHFLSKRGEWMISESNNSYVGVDEINNTTSQESAKKARELQHQRYWVHNSRIKELHQMNPTEAVCNQGNSRGWNTLIGMGSTPEEKASDLVTTIILQGDKTEYINLSEEVL